MARTAICSSTAILLLLGGCLALAADHPGPVAKLPLGKQTTWFTGPLDKEGYIDYETALNKELGKGVSVENNAVVLLWKATGPSPDGRKFPHEYFQALGIEEPAEKGDYFIGLVAFLKENRHLRDEKLNDLLEREMQTVRAPWKTGQYPDLAAWLEVNEKPIAIAVEASRRPHYFNPLISPRHNGRSTGLINAPLDLQRTMRTFFAEALTMRAMLHLGEGRYDDAWQDLLAVHRLTRLVTRGGTLWEYYLGAGMLQFVSNGDIAYLQYARFDSAKILNCLAELRNLPAAAPLADKVDLSERILALEAFQALRRAEPMQLKGESVKKLSPHVKAEKLEILDTLDWAPGLRALNQMYDRYVAALRLPEPQKRQAEFAKLDLEIQTMSTRVGNPNLLKLLSASGPSVASYGRMMGDKYLCVLFPNVLTVSGVGDRMEQRYRNLHIAFALAAYQRDNFKYPAKLNDLSPKYLSAVPNDLFSGQALIYRPADKGYLFYSVGPNGQDDGGQTGDDNPGADDIVVRMSLPELPKK